MKKLAARVKSRFARTRRPPSQEQQQGGEKGENVVGDEVMSDIFDYLPDELLCLIFQKCGPPWKAPLHLMLVRE